MRSFRLSPDCVSHFRGFYIKQLQALGPDAFSRFNSLVRRAVTYYSNDCRKLTLLTGAFVLFLSVPQSGTAGPVLPPAPALPEVTPAARARALQELEADEYVQRQRAMRLLQQGSVETVRELPDFVKQAGPEGKVRAVEIAQQIYLKLLRLQFDDEALETREHLDALRLLDNGLLGPRIETFESTHGGLMERASVRAMVRLNAVLEFRKVNRSFPGISRQTFAAELPYHIFIGEDWQGQPSDMRHVELLLLLGEQQFGNTRAVYRIQGCPVSLKEFQDLAAGLPGIFVEERSRARLGIGANNPAFLENASWEVTQIHPGSAAAHAGIRLKDIVVRLNGSIVNTFRDLTKDLEAFGPRDEITLDLLRMEAPVENLETVVPESWEDFGLQIDAQFERFPIVKSVRKDSPAAQLGLTEMTRLDRLNGQPLDSPHHFRLYQTRLKPGDKMLLSVRKLERIPVTLRGWVGPYR